MGMRAVSLATLRTLVADECELDTPSSTTHITTTQLNRWINLAIHRLTGVLSELYGASWNVTTASLSTLAGVASVSLPENCYKLKQLYWLRSSYDPVPLFRAAPDDVAGTDSESWESAPRYHIYGQTLSFVPVPSAVYPLKCVYVQILTDLSADGDTVQLGPGWDQFLIYDVATHVRYRRDEDIKAAIALRNDAERFIRDSAGDRDENEIPMARNMYARGESARSRYARATYDE